MTAFRPEQASIEPGIGVESRCSRSAEVVTTADMGTYFACTVRLRQGERVDIRAQEMLKPGTAVTVNLPTASIQVFPG